MRPIINTPTDACRSYLQIQCKTTHRLVSTRGGGACSDCSRSEPASRVKGARITICLSTNRLFRRGSMLSNVRRGSTISRSMDNRGEQLSKSGHDKRPRLGYVMKKFQASGEDWVAASRTMSALFAIFVCSETSAQTPSFSPPQLDDLVGRIAVFSDPLLTQVLAAVSFSEDIPGAAQWANQHRSLSGQSLADALWSDQLRFAPSVQALLPFPGLLDTMTGNMKWTTELGAAVLAQQPDVLNAIRRRRAKAAKFGYLRTDEHVIVDASSNITIMPRNPAYIFVPSYDPDVVFSSPATGATVADAIRFGSPVNVGGFKPFGWKAKQWESLGSYFQRWGWGQAGIDWDGQSLVINGVVWGRTWNNRHDYAHPYPDLKQAEPAQ